MNQDQNRFRYHADEDPHLRFWIFNAAWEPVEASSILDEAILKSKAGLVTYPSGEVLCYYGKLTHVPSGVYFMDGPQYQDNTPGFNRSQVRNGDGGVQITHGPSRSQQGNPRYYYATEVINLTNRHIRVTKFAPFLRGLFGIKKEPKRGCYYSPTQFREWFRVDDPQGWIAPNGRACDPDNYASGVGVWAFFFEDDQGERLIATAPLEHKPR